jgi:tetratricopeptide (TPR) repeat protein
MVDTGQRTLTIKEALELAVQHHGAGRLPEAEGVYQKILQADPNQPVAVHMLGVVAHQVGKNDIAVDLITKSLAIKPDQAEAHSNLGLALADLGKLDEALGSYRAALAIKPDFAEAHNNLGNALRELNKLDEAVESYHKALAIQPNYAEAHNNLGGALLGLWKLELAVRSYQNVLAIKPDFAEAHSNLGLALQELGKLDEAVASYQQALAIKPDYAEAHCNLGTALQALGKLDEAVASYHNALAIKPDYAEAHNDLGLAIQFQGKVNEAFNCHRRAVALNPKIDLFWASLAGCLETLSFTSVDDDLFQDLLHLIDRPNVRPYSVVRPIISALQLHPRFAQNLELASSGELEIEFSFGGVAEQLSAFPLFLRIMGLCAIHGQTMERMLTFLRRVMLQEILAGQTNEKGLPFAVALALHCFTNEYVFSETDEEKVSVENLQKKIATLLETKQSVPPSFLIALGAYRPLYRFPWGPRIGWS